MSERTQLMPANQELADKIRQYIEDTTGKWPRDWNDIYMFCSGIGGIYITNKRPVILGGRLMYASRSLAKACNYKPLTGYRHQVIGVFTNDYSVWWTMENMKEAHFAEDSVHLTSGL